MDHHVPAEVVTPTRVLWHGRWLGGVLIRRTGLGGLVGDAPHAIPTSAPAGPLELGSTRRCLVAAPAVGDRAPDFTLPGTTGDVRLSSLLAAGPVVLTFYVEDNTPACTQQLTAFRNELATIAELGAQVIAVSSDALESHREFAARLGELPFPLLSDPDLAVARLYGVADEEHKRAQRAVFVIGAEGTIRYRAVPYVPASTEQFLGIFEALGLAEA